MLRNQQRNQPSNPRAICLDALRQWEEGTRFADDILHDVIRIHPLPALDRAFLTEMFYGVLRNLSLLDFILTRLRDKSVDQATRQLLRMGIYQIFRMRTADHAAVNETVNLAGHARGLVNALLRRSLRERSDLEEALSLAPPSIQYSHPKLLLTRWEQSFGLEAAVELCRWNNLPAEVYVRTNTLKSTREELERTASKVERTDLHPLLLKVSQVPHAWLADGLGYVQDPSTLIAPELLAPQPRERVLDACAAPGGKTSYMAQLMANEGEMVACDVSKKRLARMEENLRRLGVENVKVCQQDWLAGSLAGESESFDKILVDAPCSNTGVIRRRIDVRWRLTDDDFIGMPRKQFQIVQSVAPLLKKGGALVYSTCSLEPEENERVVTRICTEIPKLSLVAFRQTLPFRDGMDGAFAARFVRA